MKGSKGRYDGESNAQVSAQKNDPRFFGPCSETATLALCSEEKHARATPSVTAPQQQPFHHKSALPFLPFRPQRQFL